MNYTRDEIERILDTGAECDKAPLDLLAIIRQLLDQADQLNALVGTVAEQAIHSRGEQVNDHLQAAKDLMADRHDDGDVFAAQTHAMIAIAESLRSGTIERTETVQHVWDAPGSNLAASEPEQAPTATPEPAVPPCRNCGPDEHPGLSDALTAGIEGGEGVRLANDQMTELAAALRDYLDESEDADDRGAYIADALAPLIEGWIQHRRGPVVLEHRPLSLADDEVIVKLAPGLRGYLPDDLRKSAKGWARTSVVHQMFLVLADGIERKEGK